MTQIDPNSDPLVDAAQLTAPDGKGAVDSSTLTLAELNTYLGTDFKDRDSALKSMKETRSFVGKRVEDIERDVRAKLSTAPATPATDPTFSTRLKATEDELFFTQNPQYKDLRDVISTMGTSPAEVVASEVFKKVYGKVQTANEAEQKRSVVSSNGRIGSSPDLKSKAVQVANSPGSGVSQVAGVFAKALSEEFSKSA